MSKALPLVLALGVTLLAAAAADTQESWQRLRSMPREQRVFLAEKVREYDRLPRDERAAIQSLDRQIQAQSAVDRANSYAILRRYHLWLLTLSDEQRRQLEAAAPDQRLDLATRFRAEAPATRRMAPLPLQIAGPSLIEIARRLKPWFDLTPAERDELKKLPDLDHRQKRLSAFLQKSKGRPVAHLTREQMEESEKKLDDDPRVKSGPAVLKRLHESPKGARVRQNLLENYYFVVNPPTKVEAANLLRFESQMPPGFREPLDPLPPEEARRRLTVLYRLIFPAPQEIPAASPTTSPSAPGAPPAGATPSPAPPRPAVPAAPPSGASRF